MVLDRTRIVSNALSSPGQGITLPLNDFGWIGVLEIFVYECVREDAAEISSPRSWVQDYPGYLGCIVS